MNNSEQTEMNKNAMDSDSTNNDKSGHDAYWKDNIKLVFMCLIVWFVVSFGFGILLVDQLNAIRLGGFKLGFWFAQQGSIYTFLGLIFFYVYQMNKLDKKYNVND